MGRITTLTHQVSREDRPDGTILLASQLELGPVAPNINTWLDHWAAKTPGAVFIAERSGEGWREMTYRQMRDSARAVATSLLERGIKQGSTIVCLSGPSVDHAVLMLAAQMIGAIIVPLAEQYSLIPDAHPRLIYAVNKVQPQLVYASDADQFAAALGLEVLDGVTRVTSSGGRETTSFADLVNGIAGPALDDIAASVTSDMVAKILFTSGSTSNPKGVPQTHRMICTNQAQYLACLPALAERPPKMLDWLPWNHVFAGNSNFYMILSNGGSLYLDDGKPVPGLFDKTIRNLKDHAGSLSCNVPAAFAMQVAALQKDADLRKAYFANLDVLFYAGASLPQNVWQALEEMGKEVTGSIPFMTSSWGMTETAPCALLNYQAGSRSGLIGIPVPAMDAKLVPVADNRYDLRVRGPNIFDGYLDDPERSREAFDEEGFFVTGDAVNLVDPQNAAAGVLFDGRIGEDFKLLTGTWVQSGTLRLDILRHLAGLVQDVVLTGHDRSEIGLLIFPLPQTIAGQDEDNVTGGAIIDPALLAVLQSRLIEFSEGATGSSRRITRALVMAEPPSVKDAEITAKGSLNINRILSHRASLVERLYDDSDPATILVQGRA